MANKEHLAILGTGVDVWNQWRKEHPGIFPNLRKANLSGAPLRGADLRGAILSEAILRGAILTEATLLGTVFGDVDLSEVKGLETVTHAGPSTIGIDTIYRSQGKIPEVFLKGAGVPDSMLTFIESLVASEQVIQFYSCFISYSDKNKAIAERLYNDLQGKGVRCWYAPHDLPIGDFIVRGIAEAIRFHEKLLLILSREAIKSAWVEFEVTQAETREAREKKTILFPVRIDDSVFEVNAGWATRLCARNIGDLTAWKDHDSYQKTFTRLLDDLKAADG